jgi:hypothetical protein
VGFVTSSVLSLLIIPRDVPFSTIKMHFEMDVDQMNASAIFSNGFEVICVLNLRIFGFAQ